MDRPGALLPRPVRLVALALLTAPILSCASHSKPAPAPRAPRAVAQPEHSNPFRDPVARAALREKALALLVAGASSPNAEQRANSIEGLGLVPTRLEPIARETLSDDNLAVRAVAAMMIGRARFTRLIPAVEPLLYDPSPMVRASAMYALSRCRRLIDLTPLADMLEDPSPHLRAHAAFLLGELGERTALGPLREAARDPMSRFSAIEVKITQLQIAEARIKLGDDDALQEVRAALYPSRIEELEATVLAAQIIGEVKDRGGTAQLVGLTAAKDDAGQLMPAEVRLAAAGSLAQLGQPRGSFIARELSHDTHATVRAQAAYVFGQTGQVENLGDLAPMLEDENELVRVAAAAGILRITESGARASAGSEK